MKKEKAIQQIERSTLFLYPNLKTFSYEQKNKISNLIADVSRIITIVNDKLSTYIRMGSFSHIACVPIIDLIELDDLKNDDKKQRVRICINEYEEYKYQDLYSDIIREYKTNQLDISHLVGLNIVNEQQSPKFFSDTNGSYDVIIKIGLDSLYNVLIAIMLDISLYHYFNLGQELKNRKSFSTLKCKAILKRSQEDIKRIYGSNIDELQCASYLPFSLDIVSQLMKSNHKANEQLLKQLIKEYYQLFITCLARPILINNNGSVKFNNNIPNKHIEALNEYFEKSSHLSKILEENHMIIIVYNDISTPYAIDKETKPMIQLLRNDCSVWLDNITYDLSNYTIYEIKIEEN